MGLDSPGRIAHLGGNGKHCLTPNPLPTGDIASLRCIIKHLGEGKS